MFISRKKNRSGSTSVVVISKASGKLKYLKTIGISSDEQEIEKFVIEVREFIHTYEVKRIVMYLFLIQLRWDFPVVNCYRNNEAKVAFKCRLTSTQH